MLVGHSEDTSLKTHRLTSVNGHPVIGFKPIKGLGAVVETDGATR